VGPQQGAHAAQRRAVTERRGGSHHGQLRAQHHDEHHHQARSDSEHGPPTEPLPDQAGRGPGQQDAQQQARHHGAHDLAPLVVGGERRRERHQHLRHDRGDPGDQQQRGQNGQGGRQRTPDQRERGYRERPDDQVPAFEQVPQRHHEQQTGGVADLRQRDEKPRGPRGDLQAVGDLAQQRLGVVQVRHNHAARNGEDQHEPPRDGAGRRLGRGLRCLGHPGAMPAGAPGIPISGRSAGYR
jgi:hypothetical protein